MIRRVDRRRSKYRAGIEIDAFKRRGEEALRYIRCNSSPPPLFASYFCRGPSFGGHVSYVTGNGDAGRQSPRVTIISSQETPCYSGFA